MTEPGRIGLRHQILRLKFELGSMLGQYPLIFYWWRKLYRPEISSYLVNDKTEVVIEGFPRSGNTFAVAAFTVAQGRSVVIAHHAHKVAQIAVAVQKEKPTLVVIRNPRDAVLSWVIRNPFLTIRQALRLYIRYYRGIEPYKNGFVLARFEEVTNDFGTVIRRLNDGYGTTFKIFDHSEENVRRSFHLIESMHRRDTGRGKVVETAIARPSKSREALKNQLRRQLEDEHLRPILIEAELLHNRYAGSSQTIST